MRSKLFGLLVVLALLLGTFGTALAQDIPEPYCGDLSEEDCALLQASREATWNVPAYKAAATYNATLAGIPGLPAAETAVNVAVDGAFSLDEAAMAATLGMIGLTQEEIMAGLAEDATPLVDMVAGMDLDMSFAVDMTPELADAFSAQSGGVAIPASVSVGLMLVDGILYVDLTELATVVAGVPEGWIGIPVAELLQTQVDAGVFAAAAEQMDPAALDPSTAAVLGMQGLFMGDNKMFEQFMTVERVEDTKVGDQAAAVIETSFDVGSLLASPEFAELVNQLAATGALGDPAQLQDALMMLPMIAPMLVTGLDIGNSVTIGLDDTYVYNNASWLTWDLTSLVQMAAGMGALPEGVSFEDPMAVDIMIDIANSDFNVDPEIAAPADAMVIPVEALMAQ